MQITIMFSAISALMGLLIGGTRFPKAFGDASWPDVVACIVSVCGLVLAVTGYRSWWGMKRREEAYSTAKSYINNLDIIRDNLFQLNLQFAYLCPQPGQILESKDVKLLRIQRVEDLLENGLFTSRVQLNRTKIELRFWSIRLRDQFEKNHLLLESSLQNISVVANALNSQLRYHTTKSNLFPDVAREKGRFDEYYRTTFSLLEERVSHSFEDVFVFQK